MTQALSTPFAPAPAVQVEARGHRCPIPTLRLRRALEAVPEGAVVVLLADDPMVRIDAPHFCAQQGHEVLEIADKGGWLEISVRKVGAPPAGIRESAH